MSLPEFAADVVASGTVLGADVSHSPDQVAEVLGEGYAENRWQGRWQGSMMRDWGLVQFFWQGDGAARPWRGSQFSVQLHRLGGGAVTVEPAISRRHGAFGPGLLIADLQEVLSARGIGLVEIPGAGSDMTEYWQPDSQVVVIVDQDQDTPGSVVKISAPLDAQDVALRHRRGQARQLRKALDQVLVAEEPQRLSWLAAREPEGADRTSWWLQLLALIEFRIEQDPHDVRWIGFHLWAVEQAQVRGALSASETAIRTAYFVNERHEHHEREDADEHVLALLPSPEEAVLACLAAVPISLEQAREPIELSGANLDAMRASRLAKNLIAAAAVHQGRLADPGLSAQLRRWTELRPNLV